MKREGRQHGMVRAYQMMPGQRGLNELRSPPAAGLFAKVSTKPTNHSKFTSRCGRSKCYGCHIHPVSKSRDKVKGAQKMRSSSDVVSNYRLITWRVVDSDSDSAPGLKVSGFSATGVLDYLEYADDYDYDYDYELENSEHNDDVGFDKGSHNHHLHEIEEIDGCGYDGGNDHGFDGGDCSGGVDEDEDEDEDDRMSFCEVGFVWQAVDEDESWCLVEEI